MEQNWNYSLFKKSYDQSNQGEIYFIEKMIHFQVDLKHFSLHPFLIFLLNLTCDLSNVARGAHLTSFFK